MVKRLNSEINEQEVIEGMTKGLKVINHGLEKLHEDISTSLIRQGRMEEGILGKYLTDKKTIMHYY